MGRIRLNGNSNLKESKCKLVPYIFFCFRYRQVEPAKLSALKELINAPNYKENLGPLIKTIYGFAFETYSGTWNQ